MFNVDSLKKREFLRKNTELQLVIEDFWNILELKKDEHGRISRDCYMILNYKLHLALVPGGTFNEKEAHESCVIDWERDCKGNTSMDYRGFSDSLCSLTDVWVEQADPIAYAAFLVKLLETITFIGKAGGSSENSIEAFKEMLGHGPGGAKGSRKEKPASDGKMWRRFHCDHDIPSLTGREEDLVFLTSEEHWMLNQKRFPLRAKHLKMQTIMSRTHLVCLLPCTSKMNKNKRCLWLLNHSFMFMLTG